MNKSSVIQIILYIRFSTGVLLAFLEGQFFVECDCPRHCQMVDIPGLGVLLYASRIPLVTVTASANY